MLNFLKLCMNNIYDEKNLLYSATIVPKNFLWWSKMTPLEMFIEGIHQFCGSAVRNYMKNDSGVDKGNNQKIFVPAQIKFLEIEEINDFEPFQIKGYIQKRFNIFTVNFEVYKGARANGVVTISKLDFNL